MARDDDKFARDALAEMVAYTSTFQTDNLEKLQSLLESLTVARDGIDPLTAGMVIIDANHEIRRLTTRIAELRSAALAQDLQPCTCGGRDLLVGERAQIDVSYAGTASSLVAQVIVCRSCGDVRFRTDARTLSRTAFVPVTLPAPDAPYR